MHGGDGVGMEEGVLDGEEDGDGEGRSGKGRGGEGRGRQSVGSGAGVHLRFSSMRSGSLILD